MSVNNTLSDFCSRIKNSSRSRVENVLIIKSKKVIKVLDILLLEGFIKGFSFDTLDKNKMKVTLKYSNNGDPIVKTIKAISKSGKRVYSPVSSLWSVQSHFSDGCVILSTSKGVMSLNQALKNNLGGELLCYVA